MPGQSPDVRTPGLTEKARGFPHPPKRRDRDSRRASESAGFWKPLLAVGHVGNGSDQTNQPTIGSSRRPVCLVLWCVLSITLPLREPRVVVQRCRDPGLLPGCAYAGLSNGDN